MRPLGDQLGNVPQVTVFGDGGVVVPGPVTEQYPPHALPNLLTGRLSRAAITGLGNALSTTTCSADATSVTPAWPMCPPPR